MPIIQKTVEAPQEQLWTVPRILKFQETVEYATGPCDSESRRPCPTGTGLGHDRPFPACVTTPSTDNPDDAATQRRFLRASSLFVEDLPEMGQRQDQTEKIQKTVAKTQGQIAEAFTVHPEDPEVCEVPRVVQRLSRSPRDPEDREDSTTDPVRSERGPVKTQRG